MKKILFLPLVLFPMILAAQSGWVRPKGDWYAQVSFASFSSNQYYNLDGALMKTNRFYQQNLSLYSEYGLSDRFTGIVQTSALRINRYSVTDAVIAPSDLRLELKYALLKRFPLSISIAPEIPISPKNNYATHKKPNELGFREKSNLATTDGELNVWTTLAASHSWGKGKGWASVFAAYNWRSKDFTDQLTSGAELGWKLIPEVYIKGRFTILASTSNQPNPGVPFFRGEGTEMSAASFGAGWQFSKKWGLNADYWHCFSGPVEIRNAYAGPVYSVGVFYKK